MVAWIEEFKSIGKNPMTGINQILFWDFNPSLCEKWSNFRGGDFDD